MTEHKIDNDALKTLLNNIEPRIVNIQAGAVDVLAPQESRSQVLLVPQGMRAESIKKYIDEYNIFPERKKGFEFVRDMASFVLLSNRFKTEHSVIFGVCEILEKEEGLDFNASLRTIVNYHLPYFANTETEKSFGLGFADNKDFGVFYDFPISKEFKWWLAHNREPFNQDEFAQALEERVIEMAAYEDKDVDSVRGLKPKFADPIEILQLSRTLEIYSAESLVKSVNLSSGERELKFTATHNGADGKPINIPDFFVLNIPVFVGGSPERVLARLRYRKNAEKLKWFYDLYRIDNVLEISFRNAAERAVREIALPLVMGKTA
jgi:uncharacterized protein YfdQ (DUF2303 family)